MPLCCLYIINNISIFLDQSDFPTNFSVNITHSDYGADTIEDCSPQVLTDYQENEYTALLTILEN